MGKPSEAVQQLFDRIDREKRLRDNCLAEAGKGRDAACRICGELDHDESDCWELKEW